MKDLWIEPKLIDLGNEEIKKDENLVDCNDKAHKEIKSDSKTDSADRYKGESN